MQRLAGPAAAAGGRLDLALDGERPPQKVDVGDLEAEELALPEAGCRGPVARQVAQR